MSWQITGGQILHETLSDGTLTLASGVIGTGMGRHQLDARGFWILPGIVDLHGDAFERHLAPRRGMVSDLGANLGFVEGELAACGITTAWLAQFWSWEGGMRGPEFATRLAHALKAADLRLDMRMQLRLETHMIDDLKAVVDLANETGLDYLLFNDHLPHKALESGKKPPRLNGSALKAGRSPEAHHAMMQALKARDAEVEGFVRAVMQALPDLHFGSHDDDAGLRDVWAARGVGIAEFPVSRGAAVAARAQGHAVIMGAPNVLRGGSHNRGSVSAGDLVAEGLVDALASDYHYPAMIGAVFALVDRGICDLAQAWWLVSEGPAQVMGLTDRGTLEAGKRGDLVILCPERRRVMGCFAAGRPVFLSGELAERLG
ncbi:alpha-D-ribose 1-methylphosphonate 5-triphosphate diphosphatase [Thioclava sp. GXIMD4216]|uniref:alpha-D-ribose 1-methylphosphonate 5-triphosphate diphosphatase n=1 Tax=Thioclava sp. GXIMD4216 TaxID=3131929 RepID=UPI0030CF9D4F